jgi:hypothetical protein
MSARVTGGRYLAQGLSPATQRSRSVRLESFTTCKSAAFDLATPDEPLLAQRNLANLYTGGVAD